MKEPDSISTFNSGFQNCSADASIYNIEACESAVKIGASGGLLRAIMKHWFLKRLGKSSPAKRLLASQEELGSMEFIIIAVGKTQIKKRRERPWNKLKDNIEKNIRETGSKDMD
jgi:hypothetical protein